MGTIADKLAYLDNTKAAIRNALSAKGAPVSEQQPFRDYASLISGLEGGGAVNSSDVNFLDYDGSLVAAYTLDELDGLSSVPAGPSHEGLVFQGWTQTLAELKTAGRPADVGAMYTTSDGATRLLLHIESTSRSEAALVFTQSAAGGVSLDWGDGSPVQTFSSAGTVNTSHSYAETGDYTVSLLPASNCDLGLGDGSYDNCVMGSLLEPSRAGLSALRRAHLGSRVVVHTCAFAYCSCLESVSLPMGLAALGEQCFTGCTALQSITLPVSLEQLGDYAFLDCPSLRSVAFTGCDYGIGAFTACYGLRSVCLPEGVTELPDEIFNTCDGLGRLSLPASLDSIGASAFFSCRSLRAVSLPDGLSEIGGSAFSLCSSLCSLSFGSGSTQLSIGYDAFGSCSALSEIALPAGVSSLGTDAFGYCYGLGRCSVLAAVPPEADTSVFSELPEDCVILVPAGSLDAYLAADGWSEYADQVQSL